MLTLRATLPNLQNLLSRGKANPRTTYNAPPSVGSASSPRKLHPSPRYAEPHLATDAPSYILLRLVVISCGWLWLVGGDADEAWSQVGHTWDTERIDASAQGLGQRSVQPGHRAQQHAPHATKTAVHLQRLIASHFKWRTKQPSTLPHSQFC